MLIRELPTDVRSSTRRRCLDVLATAEHSVGLPPQPEKLGLFHAAT
jgi:hypothetical protein